MIFRNIRSTLLETQMNFNHWKKISLHMLF